MTSTIFHAGARHLTCFLTLPKVVIYPLISSLLLHIPSAITLSFRNNAIRTLESVNLNCSTHHDIILSKAYKYKTLGFIRTLSPSIQPLTKTKLYVLLVRSQLTYCSPVWRPYLIKDINKLEHLQRRATKYVLNDFISDYKTRLLRLNLFPLMYIFEFSDIMFFYQINPKSNC